MSDSKRRKVGHGQKVFEALRTSALTQGGPMPEIDAEGDVYSLSLHVPRASTSGEARAAAAFLPPAVKVSL